MEKKSSNGYCVVMDSLLTTGSLFWMIDDSSSSFKSEDYITTTIIP